MKNAVSCGSVALLLAVLVAFGGCDAYMTAERTGNVSVQFVNDTPYRAAFSFGTWDEWLRNPPSAPTFRQLLVEGGTSTAAQNLTCARDFAVGTEEFVERTIDTETNTGVNFNPDAFDTVVHFSDQPADSDLAAVATVGTAPGLHLRIGEQFTCADQIIITFREDPNVAGGFRVDYEVIQEEF